jgi:hypothetical protein
MPACLGEKCADKAPADVAGSDLDCLFHSSS